MIDFENKVIEFRPADPDGMGKMLVSVIGNRLEFRNTIERHIVGERLYGNEIESVVCTDNTAVLTFDCHADCSDFIFGLSQLELRNTTKFVYNDWTIKFLPGTLGSFLDLRLLFDKVLNVVRQKEFGEALDF